MVLVVFKRTTAYNRGLIRCHFLAYIGDSVKEGQVVGHSNERPVAYLYPNGATKSGSI